MKNFVNLVVMLLLSSNLYSANVATRSDKRNINFSNWIGESGMELDTRLSMITLPGTHDSGSNKDRAPYTQTQSLSLGDQLYSGIRAFDIRLKKSNGSLVLHHGPIYLHLTFTNVLNVFTKFLHNHPSEFIVMRLKKETGEKLLDDHHNSLTMRYLQNSHYKKFIWENHGVKNPKLKDIRGKIVILKDSGSQVHDYIGLPYPGSGPYHQDEYENCSTQNTMGNGKANHIEKKWSYVQSQLERMSQYKADIKHNKFVPLAVNFLSANDAGCLEHGSIIVVSPYEYASGNEIKKTVTRKPTWNNPSPIAINDVDGINRRVYNRILDNDARHHLGILYMDFPGPDLIKRIVFKNFKALAFGYDNKPKGLADFTGNGKIEYIDTSGPHKPEYFAYTRQDSTYFYGIFFHKKGSMHFGYDNNLRAFPDINGDGIADFCRTVGMHKPDSLLCNFGTDNGIGEKYVWKKIDLGFRDEMQTFADVNGDGRDDFCRITGSKKHRILYCNVSKQNGEIGKVILNKHLDIGYADLPQAMTDINGDGLADFCRGVGVRKHAKMMCTLTTKTGFDGKTFDMGPFDFGYKDEIRTFVDVDGDGKDDYCRVVGGKKLLCSLSNGKGFIGKGYVFPTKDFGYKNQIRTMIDVNGDKRADYCRAVGMHKAQEIKCTLAENPNNKTDNIIYR